MSMPDDWVLPVTITFNGATEPKATMSGPAEVLAKVMTGELQGPKAFMEGKIKITGDMMFLMSLANLIV
jgi:putative sterol carrier protein